QMPELRLNQKLTVDDIKKIKKMTQPPKRFTPASIVSELEERDLGTKATRAEIIETLYRRGYVEGKSIAVTALGLAVAEALEKHVPDIMSDELTRHFEKEINEIQEGKTTQEKVVAEGKREIAKICDEFRSQEEAIGRELLGAVNEMQRKASVLGKCNKCGKGEIVVRRGKFGLFAACNAYPECKNTFPLPKDAAILATGKTCTFCSLPIVKVIRRGRRPFEMCLTPNCESKANWGNKRDAKKEEAQEIKQPTLEIQPSAREAQQAQQATQNTKPEGKLEGKPRKAPKASKKKAGKKKEKEKKKNEGVADAAA
ncbi:MAG: DNA topoisomerase, partial [Candidatus Micrarchaeota archaeon]